MNLKCRAHTLSTCSTDQAVLLKPGRKEKGRKGQWLGVPAPRRCRQDRQTPVQGQAALHDGLWTRRGCRSAEGASTSDPHLLRDVELFHHSELVVHLYAALDQLQLCEGQVTEVKLVDFVFLCIWKFSLLRWRRVQ